MKFTPLIVLSALGAVQAQDASAAIASALSIASEGATAVGITGSALESFLSVATSVVVSAEDRITSLIAASTITDASSLLALASSVSGEIESQLISALGTATSGVSSALSEASSAASSLSEGVSSEISSQVSEASSMMSASSSAASSASSASASSASSASSKGNGVELALPASGVFGSFLLGLVAYL